jgi:UDP-N-acetylglucosamine 2-epimerase (non-hydrolysing)
VRVTGNTGVDALLLISRLLDERPEMASGMAALLASKLNGRRLILMTGHRRESFDGGLDRIFRAMAKIAARPDVVIVLPVHPNPQVRRAAEPLQKCANILLIGPVDYHALVFLLKKCDLVVTASGGIQEDAPSLGKPVLVTREVTERPEAIEAGSAKLVGTDEQLLLREMHKLLDDQAAYRCMSQTGNPYGDGHASPRIAARLLDDGTNACAEWCPCRP